jgi:tetratricopeptide (TPR) repeat protein
MAAPGQDALDRGLQLLQSGRLPAAVEQLKSARRLRPADPAILYALGNALRLCNRPTEAAEALQAALTLQPDHTDAGFSLAFLYIQQAQTAQAAAVLLALCEACPADAGLLEKAASLLAGAGENTSAAGLYERASRHMPTRGDLQLQLGVQYQKTGLFAEAAAAFQRSSELDPGLGSAYMLLANTRRFSEADPDLEQRCHRALQRPGLGPEDVACIHFALGKMYDDSGRYEAAFAEYRLGNELRRRTLSFDRQAWQALVDKSLKVYADLRFPEPRPPAPGPAFIVGMVRSGTTLVSRLLGNAASVHDIGETEMLDVFIQRIAEIKAAPYPDCILELDGDELATIAADYHRQLPGGGTQTGFILDKNPLNFMHIGLIALLFPGAPIIHCRRDPLDTCLSIYFQNFAHARANYAYDLDDIAAFYSGYSRLMAFWEKRLPGRLIHVDYAALVADSETAVQELYARLGLRWSTAAARPESNPGNIATASAWQARQPIYTHSVGRWRRYAAHLQGLRQALEDAGTSLTANPEDGSSGPQI